MAKQTYTFAEMRALDSMVGALREVELAVFTPASLLSALTAYAPHQKPGHRADFDAGLAKLRKEPAHLLQAWLAGKADWLMGKTGTLTLAPTEPRPA
jgi:hypothetical protein